VQESKEILSGAGELCWRNLGEEGGKL